MCKITLLSLHKNLRSFFIVCLVFVSSFCVYGSEPLRYSSYNFSLFSPIFDFDNENTDVLVYGPITAEQAGYVNQEEFSETGNLDSDHHDHMDHDAHDHGPSGVFDMGSSSAMASNSILENIKKDALIIPMDNILQARNNSTGGFNLLAYGLVTRLLHANIPIKWAINSSKVKDGIDFTANSRRLLPTASSPGNVDYRGSAFIIPSEYTNAALVVINNFNDVIIPGLNIANQFKVKVKVYELTTQTQIEIKHLLLQKPKAAILNNGGNADIQERVLKFAGLSENDHYTLGLSASDIDSDSCFTFVSEAHADEGSFSASEV
jgi:hypothetical protein